MKPHRDTAIARGRKKSRTTTTKRPGGRVAGGGGERDGAPESRGSGLGLLGWDVYEFVVTDLERSEQFYREKMRAVPIASLEARAAAQRGEDARLYSAGKGLFACVSPRDAGSRAGRWLKRHPDGVSVLGIRVRDAEHTYSVLQERGATIIAPPAQATDHAGHSVRQFEIVTPLGDVRLRFIERPSPALPPGFAPRESRRAGDEIGYQAIDHVTSNMLTLEPWVTWLRDVMGMSEYWRVSFHTSDVTKSARGSGLASIVMWDPECGIKLANNEPLSPNFEASQIYTFVESNHGPGVQHVAFHVPRIVPAVDTLRRRGIDFLATPGTYYDFIPARLSQRRIGNLSEDLDALRRLGILVDGQDDKYLLQIFMVEGGILHHDERAGPFFYEIIQRCGAAGFGEGNFRALFEAIEADQQGRGAVGLTSQPHPVGSR